MKDSKVAVVTGSSSGIGFQTALLLARNGFSAYATMRDTQKSASITEIANNERLPLQVVQLDVNNDSMVKNAIDKITDEGKRIDVLVNNAGYGIFGALEDSSIDEINHNLKQTFLGSFVLHRQFCP